MSAEIIPLPLDARAVLERLMRQTEEKRQRVEALIRRWEQEMRK